ncbi:MAG: creatininase family protein, partial [Armatimonadetes bacterium]|nr:creatininase family protein [Armatimonadota bacterium]
NVLMLNGHGGNVGPCKATWQQFQRRYPVNLDFFPYWDLLNAEDAALLETRRVPGHAQEFETSFALAAFPENVRTAMWKDQADQEPSLSTAEKGQAMIDRTVERLAAYLRDMIEGRRVTARPEFHP